jgi:hypothetical protein
MNGYTFALSLIWLAILAGLVYLAAAQGSIVAAVILAILATVLLVGLGAGITLATQRMANEKSQADFVNNAKENLAIMASLQRVQNSQNQTLMQQLKQAARLPEPPPGFDPGGALLIEEGVFDELED